MKPFSLSYKCPLITVRVRSCSEHFYARDTCFTQSEICMVHSQEAHTTSSLIISYIKQANSELI